MQTSHQPIAWHSSVHKSMTGCIWNLNLHCCQWHNDIMPNDLKQSIQIDSANILTMCLFLRNGDVNLKERMSFSFSFLQTTKHVQDCGISRLQMIHLCHLQITLIDNMWYKHCFWTCFISVYYMPAFRNRGSGFVRSKHPNGGCGMTVL